MLDYITRQSTTMAVVSGMMRIPIDIIDTISVGMVEIVAGRNFLNRGLVDK